MDWIDLTEGMAQGKAVVNTVMNILVPKSAGNLLTG